MGDASIFYTFGMEPMTSRSEGRPTNWAIGAVFRL